LTSPELEKSYPIETDKRMESFVAAVKFANEIDADSESNFKDRPRILRKDSGLASIT